MCMQLLICFLQYLAAGIVPAKLPTLCANLRSICLWINFNDLKQISAVLCLLKSSPNLRNLRMTVSSLYFSLTLLSFQFFGCICIDAHAVLVFM